MITGDHPLTACQAAVDVRMAERPFLLLEYPVNRPSSSHEAVGASSSLLEWKSRDDSSSVEAFDAQRVRRLASSYALCVPGAALALLSEVELRSIVGLVTVFARVSPQQKEQVVLALNG